MTTRYTAPRDCFASLPMPASRSTPCWPMCPSSSLPPRFASTVREDAKVAIVQAAADHFGRTHDVIDVDGVGVLYGDGWGLVRASNTQPVLVLRFEARTRRSG